MRVRLRRNRSQPPPRQDKSDLNRAELDAFLDQTRWLIEYHDRRADSLTTRATALLGFSGVILVLLVRGPLPDGVNANLALTIVGIATVVALLLCALFCLLTLVPGATTAPGVDEHRQRFSSWVTDKDKRGRAHGDIADSYLMINDPTAKSFPVGDAYAQANRRAGRFIVAAGAMLGALIGLAVLLALIYAQLR